MAEVDAVVAGHVCVDLFPALSGPARMEEGRILEVGPLDVRPGGCVANTGPDLAALGARVRLVGDIGDDPLGRMLEEGLDAPRVDPSGIRPRPGVHTSYSVIIEPPDTDRSIWHHTGANDHFDGEAIEDGGAPLVHIGYPPILPKLYRDGGAGLERLLRDLRGPGVVTSLDMAVLDPGSSAGRADWRDILEGTLPFVDLFVPSVDDLAVALHRDVGELSEIRELGSALLDMGAGVVVLKAGPRGLYVRTARADRLASSGRLLASSAATWADRELWAPALQVDVAGTTGAGDAAAAGFLYGALSGFGPEGSARAAAAAGAARVAGPERLPSWEELSDRSRAWSPVPFEAPGWTSAGSGMYRGPSDRS